MRNHLPFFGDFLFVVDALVVAMTAALIVIGGINPLDSPVMVGLAVATIVIFGAHHVWYVRSRDEIEHDPQRLASRERRGF